MKRIFAKIQLGNGISRTGDWYDSDKTDAVVAKQQAEIDALVTALDMMKDRYMAVQYPMMWLHDVVKIDPEVEQADRLTNKYKHKGKGE